LEIGQPKSGLKIWKLQLCRLDITQPTWQMDVGHLQDQVSSILPESMVSWMYGTSTTDKTSVLTVKKSVIHH
jgi:hypothetical protein